jgi:hypothetical protein
MSVCKHFRMVRQPEPDSVAAMIRKNLRMDDDDALDTMETWRDAADECHARLTELRGREDEPSPQELEAVCRPIHHFLASRQNGETTIVRPLRPSTTTSNPSGSCERIDLPRSQQQRQVIPEGMTGLVVSHVTKGMTRR